MREARALGKLSHPNVVQVHDVGEHQGNVFVAMELVDGQPLDASCQSAPRPGWSDVIAAYLDAARGLAAAHAQGLVHRDVKPANILRGKDGRVRIADFGLAVGSDAATPSGEVASIPELGGDAADAGQALPLGETAPAPVGSRAPWLTATGIVVGTPLYMAPEQHSGGQVTPASDQYSLCAALHEGLYGVRPFTGAGATTLRELLAQKLRGVPASPPAGSPVPVWVYRALARGLAPDPADRHPSLDALVTALGEDPTARRRRRRRRAGAGVAAAILLAAGAAGWARSDAFADPCRHPEQQLAGAWDEGVKDRVRVAFQSSGRSHAEGTATRVRALLDRYAAEWSAMRGEVCHASRAGTQHGEILALRDLCLDRRRGQLQALTTLFAERADAQVLDRAVQAASSLDPIGYCADTDALAARVRPPEDPALRARVEALQPRVDRMAALYEAGKYQEGLPLAERLLEEAGSVAYPPIVAQIQYWGGRLRMGKGDYEGAKTLLRAAAVSAAEGRDGVLAALAWGRLLFVVGERQEHLAEASMILSLGPTVLAGAHDGFARGAWLNAAGLALLRMGKPTEAEDALQRCLEVYAQVSAPETSVIPTLSNMGMVLADRGDFVRARAVYERSLALGEKVLGPDHPNVATSLANLGEVLVDLGELSLARAAHERAIDLRERVLGPDHRDLALSHTYLARALLASGDYAGAAGHLGRARGPLEKPQAKNRLADLWQPVGDLYFARGDYPSALAAYERGVAAREQTLGPDHLYLYGLLLGIGRTDVRLGRLDDAEAAIERARARMDKVMDPGSPAMTRPLLALAELRLARKKPEDAVPLLERALSLAPYQDLTAGARLTLAEALWQLGKDRARARALAEEARAWFASVGHRPGVDRATRWLDQHPGPS